MEALKSDYVDIQGGTTKEGIHTGVMAGTALLALKSYVGLSLSGERVGVDPGLPSAWREVRFNIGFKGDRYLFAVTPQRVEVKVEGVAGEAVEVLVRGCETNVTPQKWETIKLSKGGA
jgi:trehalose/maltose hydrolase-like predicted phosphorylase